MMLALVGCPATIRTVPKVTKSETEIATEQIKAEWLKPCDELAAQSPENQTGNLLLDYVDLSSIAAVCKARHNSLVEYLAPVVLKEKARMTQDAK